MTKYERLMHLAEVMKEKAKKEKNVDMKAFFFHASEGFEIRARELSLAEAQEQA